MRYSTKLKGGVLLSILLVHIALGSPVVKRDVVAALGAEQETALAGHPQITLEDVGVFGGDTSEGGNREKRLLKLKALGLGAGLKAAGVGIKAVGAAGAKVVGKAALTTAVKVGAKVAKAAITIGIAKALLALVFGKLHTILGLKTKLLGGLSGGGQNGGGASASASVGNVGVSAQADVNAGLDADLPPIDPEKVSLQLPDEIISGGFNVVNKASPVVGDVIQSTAERFARLINNGLKPILRTSLGFKSFKRDTASNQQHGAEDDQEEQQSAIDEASEPDAATSQFRRVDSLQRRTRNLPPSYQ